VEKLPETGTCADNCNLIVTFTAIQDIQLSVYSVKFGLSTLYLRHKSQSVCGHDDDDGFS